MIDSLSSNPQSAAPPLTGAQDARDAALREQATQLEAFLFAELLRVSNSGAPSPFMEQPSQFQSFMREMQAQAVAASGQTGLAEAIYQSMRRSLDGVSGT